jgi:multicomponent Na+:H+ antiporter subunit B
VSRRGRIALFGLSGAGLAALLLWGLAGLPDFGHYAGPYGNLIAQLAVPQRHMVNTVTAVVFDYRGFDTMGEELLLFAAASATALLLRHTREGETHDIVAGIRSDAVRAVGAVTAIAALVLGLDTVAHGFITPGGGFQGGVVLAAALLLLFLTIEYRTFSRLASTELLEPVESIGAGAYVGLGLIALALGLSFLENFMPLGVPGRLSSGGSAILVNWSAGLAVAGGFLVIFDEYLQENIAARYGRGTGA